MYPGAESDDRGTVLAIAARDGDRAALTEWIRLTQADVWRFLAHQTNAGLADDLTQETYLRALRSLPRFAGRSSARTWLLTIARRVVIDHIRARSARPSTLPILDGDSGAELVDRSDAAEAGVEWGMLLAGLAPERREALTLTQFVGLSYAEAAEVCDCPVGTIRSRVARAREDLISAREARDNTG